MNWLVPLPSAHPVAHAIGVLAWVCLAGTLLGSLAIRGVRLGTAGVLFAGILTGYLGRPVNGSTLEFVRDFGLVLFVFAIGLQLGPGFFAAFRHRGFRMNALAAAVVTLGAVGAPLLGGLAGFDPAAVLGIFSGASINMPSLGAGVQTLSALPGVAPDRLALPALACAVTFPTAILGSLLSLLALERVLGIDPTREARDLEARDRRPVPPLERRTLKVSLSGPEGVRVRDLPGLEAGGVTVSRVRRGNETRVAVDDLPVVAGDRLLAVGTREALDRFESRIGSRSDEDLVVDAGSVAFRRVVVTDRAVLGRTLGDVGLAARLGVVVTRVTRGGIEMTASPQLRLQFGDFLQIVGAEADLGRAEVELGNAVKELNETHFIPLFAGLVLGILLGTLPIPLPGFPQPLRLGLAGGPLVVALLLGRWGRLGPFPCHMPVSANLAFRDFGITLFFAAVGLLAGPGFFATVLSEVGVAWLLAGMVVTVVPLLAVGWIARGWFGMNFAELSGLLAGSMTAPPALAFANDRAGSDVSTVAYAMVYPLTMLLRVLAAQALALLLCR